MDRLLLNVVRELQLCTSDGKVLWYEEKMKTGVHFELENRLLPLMLRLCMGVELGCCMHFLSFENRLLPLMLRFCAWGWGWGAV